MDKSFNLSRIDDRLVQRRSSAPESMSWHRTGQAINDERLLPVPSNDRAINHEVPCYTTHLFAQRCGLIPFRVIMRTVSRIVQYSMDKEGHLK